MTFAGAMAAARDKLHTISGVNATYTPKSGSGASTITVLLSYGAGDEQEGADDLGQVATMRIRVSDIAAVVQGDTVTIGSDVWEVLWARKTNSGLWWAAPVSVR